MLDFLQNHWRAILEVIILVPIIYGLYRLFKTTHAARIIVATTVVLVALTIFAEKLQLTNLHSILQTGSLAFIFTLIIVFQPELRRSLAEFGSRSLFGINRYQPETLDVFVDAVQSLSRKRFGALFAIERRMDLETHAETGIKLDAAVSSELIASVFHPRTALHDGGMILDEDRIMAAGCVFPLSQRELADRTLGLRHRAAIGISEESDCLCVVVSEESGQISIAVEGNLTKGIEAEELREQLRTYLLSRDADSEKHKDSEDSGTVV